MLVVRCRQANPIRWSKRTTNASIGWSDFSKRSGTGRFDRDDKANRKMIENILGWANRRAAAAPDPRDALLSALSALLVEADDGDDRGAARRRVIAKYRLDRTIRLAAPALTVEIQEKKTLP
jgi:hypothetical protein